MTPASRVPPARTRAQVLGTLERHLWILVAAAYVVAFPLALALVAVQVYHEDPSPRQAVWLGFACVVVTLLTAALPASMAVMSLGELAYWYGLPGATGSAVDWDSPKWHRAADALRAGGIDPVPVQAFTSFSTTANLRVLHIPTRLPGRWQVLSDWSVVNRRRLFIASGIIVAGAGVTDQEFPGLFGWTDSAAFTIAVGTVDVVVLPLAVVLGVRMYRVNVRDAAMTIEIPLQWRTRLRTSPAATVPLFAHEWSHLQHRDVLRRRLLDVYGNWLSWLVFLTLGVVGGAFVDVEGAVSLVVLAVMPFGVAVMRRVRRAIPLIHELRADADACGGGTPVAFQQALATLSAADDTRQRRARLTALTDDGFRRTVRRLRFLTWTGWILCVLPVVVGVLAGLLTPAVRAGR